MRQIGATSGVVSGMSASAPSITDVVSSVIARAHREHARSVEAATMRLLVELGGPERLVERASLHVRDARHDAVHELVLDGALVVWELVWEPRRRRWAARWLADVARVR